MTGPEHDRPRRPGASPRSGTPPPAGSPWKKGQSGNPKGGPSRIPITDALREILEQVHQGNPVSRLLAERMMKEALSGKFPFAKEIYDRVEGKAAEEPTGPAQARELRAASLSE
jgi:hypothetical protein